MLKKNNILLGAALALVLPGLILFCTEILKKDLTLFGKKDALYILSLAVNFFMIRYYFSSGKEDTARGVVLSTFIGTFLFFFFRIRQ